MEEGLGGRRPTRLVLSALGLFVLAVVVGRLVFYGGVGWALLAFLLPVIVIALGVGLGFRLALAMTAGFLGIVLLVRWLLVLDVAAWIVLMLLAVVALTALVVGKVLAALRRGPQDA